MRGQWIILTALAVVLAAAIIYMAYVSSEILPEATIERPAYGLMSQDWPALVQLVARYVQFLASAGASKISYGSLSAGLYNNLTSPGPASTYWQAEAAESYLNESLVYVEENLLRLGAFLSGNYSVAEGGFAGSLGPYPQALLLNPNYSFSDLYMYGALGFPGASVYRFVVTPSVNIPISYALLYSGSVEQPSVVGEPYNEPLSALLRTSDLKERLYLVLVNKSALLAALERFVDGACANITGFQRDAANAFIQLPWWAEYEACPLCLMDFKVPGGVLTAGYSTEVAVLLYSISPAQLAFTLNMPALVQYFSSQDPSLYTTYSSYPQCAALGYIYVDKPANQTLNDNPYPVFTFGGLDYYFGPGNLTQWPMSVVGSPAGSPTCVTQLGASGQIYSYGASATSAQLGSVKVNAAYIWANYSGNAQELGLNVYQQINIPSSWPGFEVRTAVLPAGSPIAGALGESGDAVLALYMGSGPSSTYMACANVGSDYIGVNSLRWALYIPGSSYSYFNQFLWGYGGVVNVPQNPPWYLMAIDYQGGSTPLLSYRVYQYVGPGAPLVLLSRQDFSSPPSLQTPLYVVVGNLVEDATPGDLGFSQGVQLAAYYRYVIIQPWVNPPPSVVLTTVSGTPLAQPPRQDVLSWATQSSPAFVASSVRMGGNISLAMVQGLLANYTSAVSGYARLVGYSYPDPNDVSYVFNVTVGVLGVPRGSLSAYFSVIYDVLGSLRTLSCPSALCSVSLVSYYGYDPTTGWDSAMYQISFTLPRHSNFVINATVMGIPLALTDYSALHPKVYVLQLSLSNYILANYGNTTAVFYVPWSNGAPVVAAVYPNTGDFGASMNIQTANGPMTLIMIPPASAVAAVLGPNAPQSISWAQYAPPWERPYIYGVNGRAGCNYSLAYIPGNVSRAGFALLIYPRVARDLRLSSIGSIYVLSVGGGWNQLNAFNGTYGEVWVNVTGSALSPSTPLGALTRRGLVLALCPGSMGSNPQSVFGSAYGGYSGGSVSVALSLTPMQGYLYYPDGFAVVYMPQNPSRVSSVELYNSMSGYCPVGTPQGQLIGEFLSNQWLWQYATFCYNEQLWQQYGSGQPAYFVLGVTPVEALYFILTQNNNRLSNYNSWWVNGFPNSATGGGPLTYLNYFTATSTGNYAIIPITWPLPYFINPYNGKVYTTI
jgi:hypothetical protein